MVGKMPAIILVPKKSFWKGAASTGALLLLWFFVFSSVLGYSN
jgi:hypothetical protein